MSKWLAKSTNVVSPLLTSNHCALSGALPFYVLYLILMFVPSSNTIILAIIGMTGLFATATVLTYSFRRNRTSNGKYQ